MGTTQRAIAAVIRGGLSAVFMAVCASVAGASTETLQRELDSIFEDPKWRNAQWGVSAVNSDTSEVLYQRQPDKSFVPASNMKIYTTAAALETLGPDFRYETRIYADGPLSESGTLKGDLVIIGSGDPSISGRYDEKTSTSHIIRDWAQAIRAAGIRRIEGAVVGDDDVFDDQIHAGSWQVDYYQEWYATESSGLAINENCWDVIIRPGKQPGDQATIEPFIETAYLNFTNDIITTTARSSEDAEASIRIERGLLDNQIRLTGHIPVDLKEYPEWGSVHNGTLYAATLIAEELERQGVRVKGGARDVDDLKESPEEKRPAPRGKLIHTHQSPPLSKIVAIINKPSQNFYADHVLKTMGSRLGEKGSFYEGAQVVEDFLTSAGLDKMGFRMLDGSGLSRQSLTEPQLTVGVLDYVSRQPYFDVFYDSLPIAGVDGTLRKRMKGSPGEENVRAKTGFIGRVRSLSGYLTNTRDERIIFSMMVNNYAVPTSMANDAQDSASVALINFPKSE